MQKINLISPHSHPIKKAMLKDDTQTLFDCYSGSNTESLFTYVFPKGVMENLLMVGNEFIFVDSQGRQWPSGDIENSYLKSTIPR